MSMEIPRLVVLDLYRNALSTVERLSRSRDSKKLHAWAVKAKQEAGELLKQCALDEMEDVEENSDESRERKAEEEFYG